LFSGCIGLLAFSYLSDRINRKIIMQITYIIPGIALLILLLFNGYIEIIMAISVLIGLTVYVFNFMIFVYVSEILGNIFLYFLVTCSKKKGNKNILVFLF